MKTEDWGLTPYSIALELQLERLAEVVDDHSEETIIFCSHPPVVTKGRSTGESDITTWTGEVVEVQRGGRATYHGPNQLVIYPIIDLRGRGKNVEGYLRALETALIESLQALGIHADRRPSESMEEEKLFTGVWIGNTKVASIGIAVKKWITYHGVAINLRPDPMAFQGISPCGFKTSDMSDLQTVTGRAVDEARLKSLFQTFLEDELDQLNRA
jgi:lipoyl(octanoyl) transferase